VSAVKVHRKPTQNFSYLFWILSIKRFWLIFMGNSADVISFAWKSRTDGPGYLWFLVPEKKSGTAKSRRAFNYLQSIYDEACSIIRTDALPESLWWETVYSDSKHTSFQLLLTCCSSKKEAFNAIQWLSQGTAHRLGSRMSLCKDCPLPNQIWT